MVLSTLGAAGTLIGAALGSLCISIGGAVYTHSTKVTKDRVVAAKAATARRKSPDRERVLAGGLPSRDSVTQEASSGEVTAAREPMGQVLRGLPWKRISAVTAALFGGVTMAIILAFELTTGRAVSTYTGGTSESNVGSSIPGFSARASNSIGGSTERPEQQDPAPVQQEQQDPAPVQEPEGAPEPAPNPAPEPAPNPEPNPASKQPAQEQAPQE